MANTSYLWDLQGNLNELQNWRFQSSNSDLWASPARFFYRTDIERLRISNPIIGMQSFAYLSDLVWMSNWKAAVRLATTPADGNQTLTGAATIDGSAVVTGDRILVKDQTDPIENGIYVADTVGAWTRAVDFDAPAEATGAFVPVTEGTPFSGGGNAATIWREILTVNAIWVDPIVFTLFPISTPTTDEFVKITAADTTEKHLQDAIANSTVAAWPAMDNLNVIKQVLLNAGFNEQIQFWLDLTNYVGNVQITWDLTVTGTTTLFDLQFSAGATVDRTNTTQTGTTTFDSNYYATYADDSQVDFWGDWNWMSTAVETYITGSVTTGDQTFDTNYTGTYDNSIINYTNGTVVNQDATSIYNNSGTTNYDATSVTNWADDAEINIAGDVTWEATSTQTYVDWSIITGDIEYNNVNIEYTGTNTLLYNDTMTITYDNTEVTGVVNNTGLTENYDATSVVNYNGNTINYDSVISNFSGVNEYNYDATYVGNYNYDPAAITNIDWGIFNYSNWTYNYDATTEINYAGDVNMTWDTYIENLTVNGSNLAITGWRNLDSFPTADVNVTLTDEPADWDWVFVFTDSGTLLFNGVDRAPNGVDWITFTPGLGGQQIYVKYMPASSVSLQSWVWFKTVCGSVGPGGPGLLWTIADVEVTATSKVLVFTDDSVTPVGFISAKAVTGWVEIYSTWVEPVAIPLCVIIFTAAPVAMWTQVAKLQDTWSGWLNTYVINDPLVTDDSCVNIYPKTVPAWNITVQTSLWQITITTTAANEDGLVMNYVVFY